MFSHYLMYRSGELDHRNLMMLLVFRGLDISSYSERYHWWKVSEEILLNLLLSEGF